MGEYMISPITGKRIKDYRGRKIGKLTVLELDEIKTKEELQKGKSVKYWICECECGNTKSICETTLCKNRENTTCGCGVLEAVKKRHQDFRDLNIGKRFGRLVILSYEGIGKDGRVRYLCKCDCGNTKVIKWGNIQQGSSLSCGCLAHELTCERVRLDLTGKKFGKLTAVKRSDDNTAKWICRCECGNITEVETTKLTQGGTMSCGCLCSKGEVKIRQVLDELQIKYKQQKTLDDLLGVGNGKLSYDFYLEDFNTLIEYQGQYHDGSNRNFDEERFATQKEHDKRKVDYAKSHNINLLEIWYWDYDNIEKILREYLMR